MTIEDDVKTVRRRLEHVDAVQALDRISQALEEREKALEVLKRLPSPEYLAQMFHESYERLAPVYTYETRRETRVPWAAVPEPNRLLMIAVATEVREEIDAELHTELVALSPKDTG